MRSFLTAAAGTALLATVNADLCANGQANILGNYYCQAVDTIQYQNFVGSGSYNRVTSMDPVSGACSSEPFGYSGNLAPLDGEVSFHVRGPAQLKRFAFYSPGSTASKRTPHHKRHGHKHFHAEKKRALGDMVTATIDGQVVSWVNQYTGANPTAAPVPNPVGGILGGGAAGAVQPAAKPFNPSYKGDWVREALYDSVAGTAKGLVFLNNMGGQGSGTFDYTFGNSLSYAASDAKTGAASPEVLSDITLPSNTEVILMSDKPCSAGSGCGYSRPNTVAHHGFGGVDKVFLFEFSMPSDGSGGFNADMPAIWLLNAQIPRTLQYGDASCSCWKTGCGEFDLFEVLDSGNTRCKSTLHGGVQGGDSDYFDRPIGAPIKAAVVMSDKMATIKILPDSYNFPKTLTNDDVQQLGSHQDGGLGERLGVSLFNLVPSV